MLHCKPDCKPSSRYLALWASKCGFIVGEGYRGRTDFEIWTFISLYPIHHQNKTNRQTNKQTNKQTNLHCIFHPSTHSGVLSLPHIHNANFPKLCMGHRTPGDSHNTFFLIMFVTNPPSPFSSVGASLIMATTKLNQLWTNNHPMKKYDLKIPCSLFVCLFF